MKMIYTFLLLLKQFQFSFYMSVKHIIFIQFYMLTPICDILIFNYEMMSVYWTLNFHHNNVSAMKYISLFKI